MSFGALVRAGRMPAGALILIFGMTVASWSAVAQAPSPAPTRVPAVIASILPIHSLVAGVMEGVGEPHLLVRGGASPHSYALAPHDARALQQATLVFWVGDELESFLAKPVAALSREARVVSLTDAVDLLPAREGGAWDGHGDGHHASHGHAHDTHGHRHAHDAHAHGDSHKKKAKAEAVHAHGEHDLHLWLDPVRARAIVDAAVEALVAVDAANAATYRSNGERLHARLDALDHDLRERLAPVREVPYVVFHDAYQYFERRYGMRALGSITVSPDRKSGAKRLFEIRSKIMDLGARCVFSEPQFASGLVETVIEGTSARRGVLDPLGAELRPGPGAYFELMDAMGTSLADCLSQAG